MGWLFSNQMLTHQTPAQYVEQHFTNETDARKQTVLAASAVGGAIYAAIRHEIKATSQSYVFCAVILFRNNRKDGFGTKDMDETAGPCDVDCPDRIMKLLSPIDQIPSPGYAADWRARVAAAKEKRKAFRDKSSRLVPGAILRLPHPVSFCNGAVSADAFRLIEFHGRTAVFAPLSRPGFLCRLSRAVIANAVIEAPVSLGPVTSPPAVHAAESAPQ